MTTIPRANHGSEREPMLGTAGQDRLAWLRLPGDPALAGVSAAGDASWRPTHPSSRRAFPGRVTYRRPPFQYPASLPQPSVGPEGSPSLLPLPDRSIPEPPPPPEHVVECSTLLPCQFASVALQTAVEEEPLPATPAQRHTPTWAQMAALQASPLTPFTPYYPTLFRPARPPLGVLCDDSVNVPLPERTDPILATSEYILVDSQFLPIAPLRFYPETDSRPPSHHTMPSPVIGDSRTQTHTHPDARQELLTRWTPAVAKGAKDGMKPNGAAPRHTAMSPTYLTAPPGDHSGAHYHPQHHFMPLQHQQDPHQHMQAGPSHYPQPTTYYPGAENGEYGYMTPIRPAHAPMPPMTFNGAGQAHAGPGPSTMSGRPMDGPMSMPPHAGGQSHMWAMATPTKAPAPRKRGRPPKIRKDGEGPVETPQKKHQQRLSADSGGSNPRPQKRAKKDSGASSHLPTPPITADAPFSADIPAPLRLYQDQLVESIEPVSQRPTPQVSASQLPTPQVSAVPLDSASTTAQSDTARPATTLAIARDASGRKLEFGGGPPGDEPFETEEITTTSIHPPRYIGVPSLVTNDAGEVYVDNHNVLESDMAWLDHGPSTPRTTPADSTILHTPIAPHEHDSMLLADIAETPVTKARKADKRMEAFNQNTPIRGPEAASAALNIARIGRVVAVSQISTFLGIDSNAPVTQETDMRDMFEVPAGGASPSETVVKPNWPEAPHWASVKGSKQLREEKQRAAALYRYFESASEESSDDDTSRPSRYHAGNRGVKRKADRLYDMSYRRRTQANVEAAMTDASSALLLAIRGREVRPIEPGVVGCICGTQDTQTRGSMIRCEACKTWSHLSCYRLDQVPHAYERPFWCQGCQTRAIVTATPVRAPRDHLYVQSDERSSALKRQASDIALAPSPIFPSFSQAANHSRTPLGRALASTQTPGTAARARMLSYNDNEFWSMYDDTGAAPGAPSTPNHHKSDRFSTPKVDEAPFDVMSTPSRGVGLDFSNASFFSLTPLNGRGRVPSGPGISVLADTPFRPRNVSFGQPLTDLAAGPSRSDFFRDLNRGTASAGPSGSVSASHGDAPGPASPSTSRWGPSLLSAQHVSPLPFGGHGHRRSASGNKMSSLRSSSKAGLGFGIDDDEAIQEDEDE